MSFFHTHTASEDTAGHSCDPRRPDLACPLVRLASGLGCGATGNVYPVAPLPAHRHRIPSTWHVRFLVVCIMNTSSKRRSRDHGTIIFRTTGRSSWNAHASIHHSGGVHPHGEGRTAGVYQLTPGRDVHQAQWLVEISGSRRGQSRPDHRRSPHRAAGRAGGHTLPPKAMRRHGGPARITIDGSEASAAAPRDGNYSLVSSRHYFVCSSPERSRLCPEDQGVQHPLAESLNRR